MTPGSARAAARSVAAALLCSSSPRTRGSSGFCGVRPWVPACAGMTLGSITPTSASADAVATARAFLARVDVLGGPGFERGRVELHVGAGEIALLPRLRRIER